jgi:hypothetical protein
MYIQTLRKTQLVPGKLFILLLFKYCVLFYQ